ncbi:uncharacterized protein DNG_09088 [Cephalotrichum gorgonifer]|uniref:2EXR domain-containing protein n=1 Tax=Cephalotrichum gorgonifer TaxID=2041049 RepID=A0AAE8N690_9PEZI|nr:uncharacterized protein DNG_09088 [Cephalotrichum gorgonifer]
MDDSYKIMYKALMEEEEQLEDEKYRKRRPTKSKRTFHRFERLTPELRARVWKYYCPALADQPLILQFSLLNNFILTGESLASHTETVRAMLAVNRESRPLALRELPDALDIYPKTMKAIVRFRRERDIILLHKVFGDSDWGDVPGFSDRVVNLAMSLTEVETLPDYTKSIERLCRFCLAFPNLKVLWVCLDYRGYQSYWDVNRDRKRLAVDRWPWCHDGSSRMLTLDYVDNAFAPLDAGEVADAQVWLPDLDNTLLHEEANSLATRRAHPWAYMPGEEPEWTKLIPKGNAYEWFLLRSFKEEKDMEPDMFTEEEMARLKSIYMWPLVARHFGIRRAPPIRRKKTSGQPAGRNTGRVPLSSLGTA